MYVKHKYVLWDQSAEFLLTPLRLATLWASQF